MAISPSGGGLMEITPPFAGPNAPPQADELLAEIPLVIDEEKSPLEELVGQLREEIEQAKSKRQPKTDVWIKIDNYLAGVDPNEAEEGYTESTFFYHRLPRIQQTAKSKILKNIAPLHGRPWEVKPSPRSKRKIDPQERATRLRALREEISDIHDTFGMDLLADDIGEFMSRYGGAVVYGPVQLSEPELRWNEGEDSVDAEDVPKPMWINYDPRQVYPDPHSKRGTDGEYVYFRDLLSAHQIRSLQENKSFRAEDLVALLDEMPEGNWEEEHEDWENSPDGESGSDQNRFVVWKRVGILTAEALEILGQEAPEGDNEETARRAMAESMWEIWLCGNRVLKVSKRIFQPKQLPVYFIPFRRDPNSPFGVGPCESSLSVIDMLINITRGIDDDISDCSGYQVMIDAGSLVGTNYKVRPRGSWVYRNKGVARKEGPTGKPVDFFTVPSRLDMLTSAFRLFESMLPVVSGVPETGMTGKDLGSGIRTDDMLEAVWESLEEFLKDVIGNVDRYWWKPHLRDTFAWIKEYYADKADLTVDAIIKVDGVHGAIRREIVGKKVERFFVKMQQAGMPGWVDQIPLVRAIVEGMGIETEEAVMTPERWIEAQDLLLRQKRLEAAAGEPPNASTEKERARTSDKDAILEAFKVVMTANPNDPNSVPLMELVYKLTGQLSDKARTALAIRSRFVAAQYMGQGLATPGEGAALEAPVTVDSPLELPPAERNSAQAQQPQAVTGAPSAPSASPSSGSASPISAVQPPAGSSIPGGGA
jgi:hypothetical protein